MHQFLAGRRLLTSNSGWITILVAVACAITGCANPSYFRRSQKFTPINWSRIAVLPFSGDAQYREVATETFMLHLLQQNAFQLLEPSATEVAIRQVLVQEQIHGDVGQLTVFQAQKVAQLLNVDGIFVGTITSYNDGLTFNGFSTVRLLDARTGEVVAASHKPSGLLIGWSVHQAVVAAVARTAKDMIVALEEVASKNSQALQVGQPTEGVIHPFLQGNDEDTDRPTL